MKKFTPALVAGALAASMLAGCSPSALQAVAAAAAAGANGAKPGEAAPGANAGAATGTPVAPAAGGTAPVAPAAGGTTPVAPAGTPADKPAAGQAAGVDPARKAKFDAFKALVEKHSQDSRMTARLFVMAFTQYAKDKDLALAMMTLISYKQDLRMNPDSLSGFSYVPAREIYWRTIDKNPAAVLRHIKGGQEAADSASALDGVIIDDDYKAANKGEFEPGAKAKYYFFTYPVGAISPRPVALVMEDGRWRVSEFSSITV